MTFVIMNLSTRLLGLSTMDKYPHVGICNTVCIIVAIQLYRNVIMTILVNNNTFLLRN